MAATVTRAASDRAGAEITYGHEECYKQSIELLKELGFPSGVMPLKELEECGIVKETGFIWMKQKKASEHFFETTNSRVAYAAEVTAYVEKFKMKKMTGVKTQQLLMWVPIAEMSIVDHDHQEQRKKKKICFKTPVGIGKSYPVTAFMGEDEKNEFLE